MACPSDEYCSTYMCSLVAKIGNSSFLYVLNGDPELHSKSKRRMDSSNRKCGCLQKQLYLDKSSCFQTKVGSY